MQTNKTIENVMRNSRTHPCDVAKQNGGNLEDVVADVVDLDDGRVALAELGVEHALEARRGRDEDDLVRVEDAALDAELHVAQLGIVDELGVDARPAVQRRVADLLDALAAVARGEDVSQQQRRALVLYREKKNKQRTDKRDGPNKHCHLPRVSTSIRFRLIRSPVRVLQGGRS